MERRSTRRAARGPVRVGARRFLPAATALLCVAAGAPAGPGPGDGSAPAHLALLVGIDDYTPPLPPLAGARADVERVAELLRGRFGFAEGEIVALVDEQATVAALVGAFHDHLIARAGPETEVVFWYSGHGSRVVDASGRDDDGLDSTLVLWDSRREGRDGSYDLPDDALRSLVDALAQKTSRILVVVDACHAGGLRGARVAATRGLALGSEPISRERLARCWPEDVPWREDAADLGWEAHPRWAYVGACRPRELAHEWLVVDAEGRERTHGALTWFLTRALERARPGDSYRRVADEAAQRLAARFPSQTVVAAGALDRELFAGRFDARPPGFPGRVLEGGRLRVEAGRVHGLRAGSALEVRAALGQEVLGRAVVEERVGTASALARWTEGGDGLAPGTPVRAFEVARPPGEPPLSLWAEDPEWARPLVEEGLVRLVSRGRAEYGLAQRGGSLELLAGDGVTLWSAPRDAVDSSERAALTARLADERLYRSLCALAECDGGLPLEASFRAPTAEELATWREAVLGSAVPEGEGREPLAGGALRVRAGRGGGSYLVVLEVANPGDAPLHVAVLSLSQDRMRTPIHPRGEARPLPPGGHLSIPIGTLLPASWPADRPMRDRYVVAASPDVRIDFSPLASGAVMRGGDAPPEHALPGVLGLAASPAVHRGPKSLGRARPLALDRLAIRVLDLLVEADD